MGPNDWEEARNALYDLISASRQLAQGEGMAEHHKTGSLAYELNEGLSAGAFFTAEEYPTLCAYAASANAGERNVVSLVLPIVDSDNILKLVPESIRSIAGEFVTWACVDISARSAFLLASNLPLLKPAPEMLKDNGLTIQALSVKEVLSAVRGAGPKITKKGF